jgi:hypothetical protein
MEFRRLAMSPSGRSVPFYLQTDLASLPETSLIQTMGNALIKYTYSRFVTENSTELY